MSDKRIQLNKVVASQLPSYVREEFPLIGEFLKQYYISQEFQGAPVDLIQNIDQYLKLESNTNLIESTTLLGDISFLDTTILVQNTDGFPDRYGILKINSEIITYTSKTPTSFVGCIRGFSGITSYKSDANPENLVFSQSESDNHSSGSVVENLSILFLKEFLLKIKYQFLPGLENRELFSGLNENLFIKQAKDFYQCKGSDESFKILFKALYGEKVDIIKPKDYLFRPSDALYRVTQDFVAEIIDGNPDDLVNLTLYQDEYASSFTKAYAPITSVEKLNTGSTDQTYYKISIDSGYNRDSDVDGSVYGKFSVHPKTKVIGQINSSFTSIDVDSTLGFPESGTIEVKYNDGSTGVVTYGSKTVDQFTECSNITGIIEDGSEVNVNTYAYADFFGSIIKVRFRAVLNNLQILDSEYYSQKDDTIEIKTLGTSPTDFVSNNWFFNVVSKYNVTQIELIDQTSYTYRLTLDENHIFRYNDFLEITSSTGVTLNSKVIDISSEKVIIVNGQGQLDSNSEYVVKRKLLKVNSTNYPELSSLNSNIQNVYKSGDKLLVASPSIPSYKDEQLTVSNIEADINGTFSGETFKITTGFDHGFYTGDSVYYTPEKQIVTTTDIDGNEVVQTTILSSLFDEGLYFVKRVDENTISFARSKSDIFNGNFINLENEVVVRNNKIQLYRFANQKLASQKILREIAPPVNDGKKYETQPGLTGILISGVEVLNYKSLDKVYYGEITELEVVSGGDDYDVINPPTLNIKDAVGSGATGYCAVQGSLREIRIIDPGFDYVEKPIIKITGGQGTGARAEANMILVDNAVSFNSAENAALVSISNNTIGFTTYHKFRNAEKVVYKTFGQKPVVGLTTSSYYYASVKDAYTISLHRTFDEASVGINTINITDYGRGNHTFESANKKSIIGSITVLQPGFGYKNQKRSVSSVGINTASDEIQIRSHGYSSGELVTYTCTQTPISGLTTQTNYYVTKIDDNTFKLSEISTSNVEEFNYRTKQYVNLRSTGSGTHYFNYPQISVEVIGKIGISSIGTDDFKAVLQPIFRGSVTSVHLESGGVGYGAPEILNYEREPLITLYTGANAQVTPIVSNGSIVDVLVNKGGSGFNSPPTLNITTGSGGFGASLIPVIENGQIKSVKINRAGSDYVQGNTEISITPSGFGAKFKAKIKNWTVNLFRRYYDKIGNDDGFIDDGLNDDLGLQYCHIYAPRKLRESVYSTNQIGRSLYGRSDLRRVNRVEVNSTNHSPIIGWAYDGNPIYGPYGYSNLNGGVITQMKSGYVLNLKPDRPPVSVFPQEFFVEDFDYVKSDDDSVLDENNGRFCITPEFPKGTYAYFASFNPSSDVSGTFLGYKRPAFPYLIGKSYVSKPNEFNFNKSSNQYSYNLNQSDWLRVVTPYNFANYDYVLKPYEYVKQTIDVKYASPGSVDSVGIITGGNGYQVNDRIVFSDTESGGTGVFAKVSEIKGKAVNNVSVASSTINNLETYTIDNNGSFIFVADSPHNFNNEDLVTITGVNTTSSLLEGSYQIGITTSNFVLKNGVGTTAVTGIVTYFSIAGKLDYPNIIPNDILRIGTERIKVLNVDKKNSRIRVLRAVDSTVGTAHSSTDILYEVSRKIKANVGYKTTFDYKLNTEIYFDPSESVGLGTNISVGAGTTLTISNPGAGATQIFVPTKTIYLPNHSLKTGDSLIYRTNGGSAIGVSTNGISTSVTISDESVLYVAKISEDLIGISTVKVGLNTLGTFAGIGSTTQGQSTLYFTTFGSGNYHSFETNYESLTVNATRNVVTVSVAETHGLRDNDIVNVNVNPSISTSYSVQYDDYNRRLIVNPFNFSASAISTTENTITIPNHNYFRGQKVVYKSASPSGGLTDEKIYYVYVVDDNIIKLTESLFECLKSVPTFVDITSASSGSLLPVNPPLKVYRNSTVTFNLSDSSLSYSKNTTSYPAFEFEFFVDEKFENKFEKTKDSSTFEVIRTGIVGVTSDAKVTLSVNENLPEKLYYKLVPINTDSSPAEKQQVIVDDENVGSNQVQILRSGYSGTHRVFTAFTTSFTYQIPNEPESSAYSSSTSKLDYTTISEYAYGPISDIEVTLEGQNYFSLPGISTVLSGISSNVSFANRISGFGDGAILEPSSKTIGKIKKLKFNSIGFDYPSDNTLKPTAKIPEIIKIERISSIESIGITSFGYGYYVAPKLLLFDGKTGELKPEVDLRYEIGKNTVSIFKNTEGIYRKTPTILPINNSNGVGIGSISYNPTTKDVTVRLAVGFSTANTFPFSVNDRVLIENVNVGIASTNPNGQIVTVQTGKGYNSQDYGYKLFTIKSVDENRGGIGIVTFSLDGIIGDGETPGTFNPTKSAGRIIPEKFFPTFNIKLKDNTFNKGETVVSKLTQGIVENWDPKTGFLKVQTNKDFVVGEKIEGRSSKTVGIISAVTNFNSVINLAPSTKQENGWDLRAGFLNDNQQRISDNDYYQNFSYSVKSRVDYDTWSDAVGVLNHTVGFKKFSDLQVESVDTQNSMVVGLSTDTTQVSVVNDLVGVANLNCVYDFDLVKENNIDLGSSLISNQIIFNNRILTDYSESVGNRVLKIDDFSGEFNSNPRPTRYSEVARFSLSGAKAHKFITYVRDKRYNAERQLMIVDLINNSSTGYLNQYARLETSEDLGSFDFAVSGTEGVLQFYPNKYSINDYDVVNISYNLLDTYTGTGYSTFGVVDVITDSSSSLVSAGSTTIVSIGTTYTSGKILVEIKTNNDLYEFDELNFVHDGTEIELLEYGQLTNHSPDSFSSAGLGTYYPYISGSEIKVDFIPFVGVANTITVNSICVAIGNTSSTGIGSFNLKNAKIGSNVTSIAATSSPTAVTISEYDDDYDSGYFIVQVSDLTNNQSQISEVVVIDDNTESYSVEYGILLTDSYLGTVGTAKTDSITKLTFTPNSGINVQVRVFYNFLRYENVMGDDVALDFTNANITSGYGDYAGTDRDVRRSFELTHSEYPIFQRYFDGSVPSNVGFGTDVSGNSTNEITIPNHFFVTGEELVYTHAGSGTSMAIGIGTTTVTGIGTTDKLPSSVFVVKVDQNKIKLAETAAKALKPIPEIFDIVNVGIGTSHSLISKNQNAKVIVAIDNIIQSPIVGTSLTSALADELVASSDLLRFTGITSFFGGDLIKIGNEIMRITSVGVGSTNVVRVQRPWMGTVVSGYSTGALITRVTGNYNIVDNTINFVDAPYGNIPLSTTTAAPDQRDWIGITTHSKFQGRVFLRSGITGSSNETYHKNKIYDDISNQFNGIKKDFTLKSDGSNISGIEEEYGVFLINDIFQAPGLINEYTLNENVGVTTLSFTGTATSESYDPNSSSIPVGGIIASVGSSEGFGYQPLISAGGTCVVSVAGTVQSISIGNSGSGYRGSSLYEVQTTTTHGVSVGSTIITLNNENSVFKYLSYGNTGSNCTVAIGTHIKNATITSVGATFVTIGGISTSSVSIPADSSVRISVRNAPLGIVNVGVAMSTVGINTVTHVGITTVINGRVDKNVIITNSGFGYTSSNPPFVVVEDPLSYSNLPLYYSSRSVSGFGTEARIDIVVGQGSSIIDFEIRNTGYGYGQGEILTIPVGGVTGIPTTGVGSFDEFNVFIQNTSTDKFSGWSIGQLQPLDSIDDLFDSVTRAFTLRINGNITSIVSSRGSSINVEDTLIVFYNDVLQVPGEGYSFPGGSVITFSEAPKPGDRVKILFYRGSGSVDVVDRDILETVKVGDLLTIGYDSSIGQPYTYQEDPRIVTSINSTDLVDTNPYFGPGNVNNPDLLRPVVWCRQTEDRIVDGKEIGKDRDHYEARIYPTTNVIQTVGIGSTVIYVENLRTFFDAQNENNVSLSFQKDILLISQGEKVGASATAVVSAAGTISSIVISDGGVGYTTAPDVVVQNPVGLGTTQRASASATISSGSVSGISINSPGVGYTTTNPPVVLIEPPSFLTERINNVSYFGDFGLIVGVASTSVTGVASTALLLNLYIPTNSPLRDSAIVGSAVTISGISTGDYFVVSDSNYGNVTTSLRSDGSVIGIGTTCIDNVYQVIDSNIVSRNVVGYGSVYLNEVLVSVSDYNDYNFAYQTFDSMILSFDSTLYTFDSYVIQNSLGNFSWGRIEVDARTSNEEFNFYNQNGIAGIKTSAIVRRYLPLKYNNYIN